MIFSVAYHGNILRISSPLPLPLFRRRCYCFAIVATVSSSLQLFRRHCYCFVVIATVSSLLLLFRRHCYCFIVITIASPRLPLLRRHCHCGLASRLTNHILILFSFSLLGDSDLNRRPILVSVLQNLLVSDCTVGSPHTTFPRSATLAFLTVTNLY